MLCLPFQRPASVHAVCSTLNAVLLQLLTTIVDTLKLYPSAHFSIVTAAMPAAATAAATAGWQQQQQQQQQSNMSNTIAE
jgi:hypothetical protein